MSRFTQIVVAMFFSFVTLSGVAMGEEPAPTAGTALSCAGGLIPLGENEFSLKQPEGCEGNARLVKVVNKTTTCVVPQVASSVLPPTVTRWIADGTRMPVVIRTGSGPTGFESCIPACTSAWMFQSGRVEHVSGRGYNAPRDLSAAMILTVNGIPMLVLGEYQMTPSGIVALAATLLHRFPEQDNYLDQPLGREIVFERFTSGPNSGCP